MGSKCMSGCFVFYIVLSLLSHVAELVMNGMLAYELSVSASTQDSWFSLVAGILLIPLVLVHLLSAILLLNRRGDTMNTCDAVIMAFLHIIQLGFIWRHFTVLRERNVLVKKAEIAELFLLKMTYAFAAGFPLMLIQAYLILINTQLPVSWILYLAATTSLLSTTWSVASFRRQHETCDTEDIILTWPGSVFRLTWRAGEIAARVISLSLFATLYSEWLFLVIGLHWLTMLVCLCTSIFSAINESSGSKVYKISFRVLIAYMYIFVFINFSTQNSMFRYVMYYVILFLENGTLCLVWLLQETGRGQEHGYRYLLLFITATCFFVAIVSLTIYYRFFHVSIADVPSEAKALVCVKKGCINCKLSLCVKHKLTLQRPFSAGWYSQYNEAVYNGHYYKNLLQDSFLDSVSDSKSIGTVRSAFIKPGTISEESNTSFIRDNDHLDVEKRSVVSFQSAGTYSHKRYFQADVRNMLEDDLQSEASSVPASLLAFRRVEDVVLSESSLSGCWVAPPGRSASQTCLLTDTWDSISQLNTADDHNYPSLPSCRSLMRDDHNWYSDGYTTDNTLVWSKLPVTNLNKVRPVVSDSESEYYCHCGKAGRKVKVPSSSQRNRPHRSGSLSDSVQNKYINWSRKTHGFKLPVTQLTGPQGKQKSKALKNNTSKQSNKKKKLPAWALDSDSNLAMKFQKWEKPTTHSVVKPLPALFDIRDDIAHESALHWGGEDSPREMYHNMDTRRDQHQGHYVKSRQRRRHSAGRHHVPFSDSESETQFTVRPHRTRKSPANIDSRSQRSRSADAVTQKSGSTDLGEVGTKTHALRALKQEPSSERKEITVQKDSVGIRNIRAVQGDKSKWSTDSGVGQMDYENEYVPMRSASHKKVENVYENQAYIGDSNEVLVMQAGRGSDEVFVSPRGRSTETPWYVCSESEDSALPHETFSSSLPPLSNSDHESDDSLELII